MKTIEEKLRAIADPVYREFSAKLTPNVPSELFLGVRLPDLRKLAKTLPEDEKTAFLAELPHRYFDENMLHGILLSGVKDYDLCIAETERFLPYIDNWAVCDTTSPKCFGKHKAELLEKIDVWLGSAETYIVRFGIGMLMRHFLDGDFEPQFLEKVAAIRSEEYYVNMMIAWYFATALAKQWNEAVKYIEDKRLDKWTHNKAIQKARESYRVSEVHKQLLHTLRI